QAAANRAPTLDAPTTVLVTRDEIKTIDLHATDPDGDQFTLSTSSPIATLQDGKLILRSSVVGTYSILITAEDNKHTMTTVQLSVQVEP
ncbi:MAG: hypothetical protein AABY13_01055, partial [Nanoarchaeota archaeon]